jgi:hypothetical protein
MKTVLLYLAALASLIILGSVLDHHKDATALIVAWALSFFLWVCIGLAFAVRGSLRWLRR